MASSTHRNTRQDVSMLLCKNNAPWGTIRKKFSVLCPMGHYLDGTLYGGRNVRRLTPQMVTVFSALVSRMAKKALSKI